MVRSFLIPIVALVAACSAATPGAPPQKAAFRVDNHPLPGEGRGDYIVADPAANRLYVTHTGSLQVLDLTTLETVYTVGGLKWAHGVALDQARGHGFVTDGDANVVVMFDLTDGKTLKAIPAGTKPDSILRDPASGLVFAFNGESNNVSVIDPATAAVVKTIDLGAAPEFSQADGKGKVWVNLDDGNAIAEIDSKTLGLARKLPLAGCEGPAPLAFDKTDRLLFSGCGNRVMTVLDADSGKLVATVPVGEDPDGIAYDEARARIFVGNRSGGWTIVRKEGRAAYKVEQTLPMPTYAKTAGLDPVTHRVFSSTADLIWPPRKGDEKPLPLAKSGTFRLVVISEANR